MTLGEKGAYVSAAKKKKKSIVQVEPAQSPQAELGRYIFVFG